MATLTPTLTLSGSAADFGSALTLSTTDTLTIAGDVIGLSKFKTGSIAVLLTAADYTSSYVYLKNTATVDGDNVTVTIGTQTLSLLLPGEFAYFPWDSLGNISVTAAANTPIIEYALFEIA